MKAAAFSESLNLIVGVLKVLHGVEMISLILEIKVDAVGVGDGDGDAVFGDSPLCFWVMSRTLSIGSTLVKFKDLLVESSSLRTTVRI